MSDAKKYRDAGKAKAHRLANGTNGAVDASGWKPSDSGMNADKQTGLRPVSRQHLKTGGRVHGDKSVHRADRTVRLGNRSHHASGGAATADANTNRNVKSANAELGKYHTGGLKSGGRAKRADGGSAVPAARLQFANSRPNMINKTGGAGLKKGGAAKHDDASEDKAMIKKMIRPSALKRAAKCGGGAMGSGDRPEGGRLPRKSGGRAGKGKGKTNINIIIGAQEKPQGGPPMPMPPPGGRPPGIPVAVPPAGAGGPPQGAAPMPMPMPQQMPPQQPMPRKAGGRTYRSYKDMDAGAMSGLGRLEKSEIQKRART
jgi:hypothetical protein